MGAIKETASISSGTPRASTGTGPTTTSHPTAAVRPGPLLKRLLPTIRPLGLALATTILVLGAAAAATPALGRRTAWLSPILSPTISSWFAHFFDTLFIRRRGACASRWQRLLWDGVLAAASLACAGVLAAMIAGAPGVWGDTRRVVATNDGARAIGGIIVALMIING